MRDLVVNLIKAPLIIPAALLTAYAWQRSQSALGELFGAEQDQQG